MIFEEKFKLKRDVVIAATASVTLTYVYFLVFAQFGFLKAVTEAGTTAASMKVIMACMGLAGMGGSALAAKGYSVQKAVSRLITGYAICAAAAAVSLAPQSFALFLVVAVLVGLGLGLTTVTLACMLRRVLGGEQLGTLIGLGTGLAYATCNLPQVFNATAKIQAITALMAALAGIVAAKKLTLNAPPDKPAGYDYTRPGMVVWVALFLALVCLDSAAFYLIQHVPSLRQEVWAENAGLMVNAGVHLLAALLAGYALDRRWMSGVVACAAVALMAACYLLDSGSHAFAQGAILYTAAVSAYSAALVFYPARGMRPWLAAAIYSIAGWGGSAIGIGFAQGVSKLPWWFVAVGAVIIFGALHIRQQGVDRLARQGIN
ncbi:hypothetical protein [Oleiharenicola lentus]|uniref:hypothetical protein n=1 Tax=Oleiharenicola lentus TaxID=2508720 RepID=UPI003F66CFB7